MSRLRLAARVGLALALALALAVALVTVLLQGRAERTRASNAVGRPEPAPSVSPSPSPSPQPSQPEAVPTPDTTGRDFDRIVRELIAFRDWLFRNPERSDLLSQVIHPECECFPDTQSYLEDLARDGLRFDDEGFLVHGVELAQDLGTVVRVKVTLERAPQRLVDGQGHVVDSSDGAPPTRFSMSLLEEDGQWLIRTATELRGP